MENVSVCRFSPTDHGSICNSNILKYRVTTFRLDTLEMILSRTQHINHITHLVAINKLYDTTVTCLAQFPDSTSETNIIQLCNNLNLIFILSNWQY